MKPKDLNFFYKFGDRKPLLVDNILCVPRYYDRHDDFVMPDLHREIFKNENPVHIEFCSGNGEWIAKCAIERPDINWIAVERKFTRARKIWSKMKNHNLKNIFIVCGNAEDFSDHYLQEGSISEIYINFPDPWPKLRHVKHRLIKQPFVKMMARILKPGAAAYVVTDDLPYASQAIEEMQKADQFSPAYEFPHYRNELENYGSSYFNRLWVEMGRKINYIKYLREEVYAHSDQ